MSYQPNLIKQFFHNTRRFLARHWLQLMPADQIAITGSQGKTSTSSILFHVLSAIAPTVRTDLNLDTVYNVPITALKVRPSTKHVIFELGIDHPDEMDIHLSMLHPKIAVVTGISPVHTDSEHLGSLEALIAEKRKLIEALPENGYAILNGDDEYVRVMAKHTKAHIVFYGTDTRDDIYASQIKLTMSGTSFLLRTKNQNGETDNPVNISVPLLGRHTIYSVMATLAVCRILRQTNFNRFQQILTGIKPLNGRMSLEKGPRGTLILNDSLRANPASTASGLNTLSQLQYDRGRKIAVLGEMGELEKPEEEHAKIGMMFSSLDIDCYILVGAHHRETKEAAIKFGIPESSLRLFDNNLQAGKHLKSMVKQNDLMYLKGSLLRHMERILMILNDEDIRCEATTCPFYQHCPRCPYRLKGYQ